ncbi:hypothetical protein V8C86DRAFT_2583140 [Haematococcus lacustris]
MRRAVIRTVGVLCCAGTGAVTYWAWPEYACVARHGQLHGEPHTFDVSSLRRVGGGSVLHNPGVQVFPDLLDPGEAASLLAEVKDLVHRFGINLITPHAAAMYRWQQSYLGKGAPPVNMLRVTGRPEAVGQRLAPWGYAEELDEVSLPPQLKALVARVRSRCAACGQMLGPLRDVTLNARHSGFLRLDPHIDPAADGEHVFILGLDSDTVLTLSPARALRVWQALQALWAALTLRDEREAVAWAADHSWSPLDIDVLARARSLVHLSGPARWTWTHGTRLGSRVAGQGSGLHDWWGTRDQVILRSSERHSVVLAFGEAAAGQKGQLARHSHLSVHAR